MKNFITPGENITVPAPAAVVAGQAVVVGSIFGVATDAAASGADVVLVRRGVFELPKTSAQAWGVGDKLYWSAGSAVVTTVASGNTLIGAAAAPAANPSSTGFVLLTGQIV